jgi:O-antigen ligase
MFAGLLFVGELKTVPAKDISFSDPTMLMFLLCCGAIAMDWLRDSISGRPAPPGHVLAGQTFRVGLFMLFVGVMAASFIYTPAEQYGRTKLLRFLTFETLVFFGPILLLKSERELRPLLWAMIILSFPLLAKQIITVMHPSQQMLRGNADVTEIGHGMAFGAAILIAIYTRLIRSRIMLGCVLVLMSVGLVTAAARTPALALIVTLIISSFVLGTAFLHLSLKRILPILLLIAVVAWLTFLWVHNRPGMHDKLASKQNEIESMMSGSTAEQGTIARRLEFYNSALNALRQHPFIGLGLGGWSVFYSGQGIEDERRPIYPHNFLLEVASEQGLPGLALLLALLASLFYSVWKLAKYPQFVFLFPLLTFQVLNNSFTGTVEDRSLWFWFGMVVAVSRMVYNSEMPFRAAQAQRASGDLRKGYRPYDASG